MQGINDQVFSVSQFNKQVKLILETEIPPRWISGEVSNLRRQTSGHIYFTLKDATSQLACVLFRSSAIRQNLEIQEGQQILVYGEISVYEPRGSYQLIVSIVLANGQGKLQLAFEQLKQILAAEGLFDSLKKKQIPFLPKTIGIVTSSTGAAIHDFISVLRRRGWHGRLIVLPAKVQGNDAVPELITQIERASRMGIFDLLVICRGGGSLEDLWCFNEEALVRAIAKCPIPIISGIGHEIDFTLADFSADLRAETPTAAAEIISSSFIKAKDRFHSILKAFKRCVVATIDDCNHFVESLSYRLSAQSPQIQINQIRLRLDDISNRISSSLQKKISLKRRSSSDISTRLLAKSPEGLLGVMNERLQQIQKRLMNNSIDSGLKRGFTLIQDSKGHYITHKKNIINQEEFCIVFSDGKFFFASNSR